MKLILKKSLPLILFLFSLNAEELKVNTFSLPVAPSEEILLRNALNLSEYSISQIADSSLSQKDCTEKDPVAAKTPAKEEAFCFCELTDEEIKRLPFIGEFKAIEYDLVTGNDNFLHGIARHWDKWLEYDGDDRGRTFGIGNDFSILGSEGELKIGLHSTGFGRLSQVDGKYWSPDNKRYLEFLERDTFSLRADKFLFQKENSKIRLIGELKLDHFNDEGDGARLFQEKWHQASEKFGIIQYKYKDHLKPMTETTISVGIGRDFDLDVARFKCQFRSEVQLGLSTYNQSPLVAKGRLSSKITHQDIPWMAVSLWAQEAKDLMGHESSQGLNVSFPIKGKNVTVTPYFGVEKHKSSLDRSYASDQNKASELYHVLGVTIRY